MKALYQICVVVDDWAESRSVMHSPNNIISSLFLRGRHQGISTIVSSQTLRLLDPVLRANATSLYIFKMRNSKEIEKICEELGGITKEGPGLVKDIYYTATEDKFSFLYVNLMEQPTHMFWIRFDGGRFRLEDLDGKASPR